MPVLAIDQGTTSTRALRIEDDGRATLTHALRHEQHYPAAEHVEHDPRELLANVRRCIDENPGVTALGIDNQGESCLAWRADTREPICPVIVWQDNRTQGTVEQLARDGAAKTVMARAGLPMDSYFSASKLAWILDHVNEARPLLREGNLRLGTTDAWFLDHLTGRCITDITTASRTSLMNLETGCWDESLCDLFGVPIEALPEIVGTTGELGVISSNGTDIALTASVVDQQASLYGHGCRDAGDAKITFGTGAFALAVTGPKPFRAPERGLLPTVAWQLDGRPPAYALDGGVYSAGAAIEWARSLNLFSDYEEINAFNAAHAIERDLVFVPALTGLACPHWDRRAGGLWLGLSPGTTRQDMVQAVIEGVAFRAAEVIRAMAGFIGIADAVSIDGGLSANPYFCQFLADVTDKRIVVRSFAELTALGTAALAGANVEPVLAAADAATYSPRRNMGAFVARFDDAVSRAGHWRRTDTA